MVHFLRECSCRLLELETPLLLSSRLRTARSIRTRRHKCRGGFGRHILMVHQSHWAQPQSQLTGPPRHLIQFRGRCLARLGRAARGPSADARDHHRANVLPAWTGRFSWLVTFGVFERPHCRVGPL